MEETQEMQVWSMGLEDPLKEEMTPHSHIFAWEISWIEETGGLQSMGVTKMSFSGSNVQMWELDHKEGWALKNWCFWIVLLKKTLERPVDKKEIKLVNPKGNQPWIFIGRTGAEAEAPILWPPDTKSLLTGKDSNVGKDWRQEEKGVTEAELVG